MDIPDEMLITVTSKGVPQVLSSKGYSLPLSNKKKKKTFFLIWDAQKQEIAMPTLTQSK